MRSALSKLRLPLTGLAAFAAFPEPVRAQSPDISFPPSPAQQQLWRGPWTAHQLNMKKKFPDPDAATQTTPPFIPIFQTDPDPAGTIGTYQPGGGTVTSYSDFFSDLGTNQRTCFTCHQMQTAWTISADDVQRRFAALPIGSDPIFRTVDGANCPNVDTSTIGAKQSGYSLLLGSGLIRIGLPLPTTRSFDIVGIDDPYGCSANAVVRNPDNIDIYSFYRRPLASSNLQRNLGYRPTCVPDARAGSPVMWDGREFNLLTQAKDATLGHAQADPLKSFAAAVQSACQFEIGLNTAQESVASVILADLTANGGSKALGDYVYSPGPRQAFVTAQRVAVFDLFDAWRGSSDGWKASIYRGQEIFNKNRNGSTTDPAGCGAGACHNVVNLGTNAAGSLTAFPGALIVANATNGATRQPGLGSCTDRSTTPPGASSCSPNLPTFRVKSTSSGKTRDVHDLGLAMITGNFADIGAFKVPALRGLAGKAPYFHDGSAKTLVDLIEFYNAALGLGLDSRGKQDLANFLSAL